MKIRWSRSDPPPYELQADYLAGVWAQKASHETLGFQKSDIEHVAALLEELGDDKFGRTIVSSHGTGQQRKNSFMDGMNDTDFHLKDIVPAE